MYTDPDPGAGWGPKLWKRNAGFGSALQELLRSFWQEGTGLLLTSSGTAMKSEDSSESSRVLDALPDI